MKNINTGKKQAKYSKIACFLFVLSLNLIFLIISKYISTIITSDPDTKLTILKFVLIPISSFLSGYFTYLLTSKIKITSLASLIVSILGPLLIFPFSFQIFLWAFLYFINSFIGFSVAMCTLRSY